MANKTNVGIIGVGNISPAYIKGCRAFDILDLVACADLDVARARQVAQEHAIPRVLTVDELVADPQIDVVINLTIPAAHAAVSRRVLEEGKHLYSEKPLATSFEDGRKLLALAQAKGLRIGCAPDTFMFAPHQTARRLLDEGTIGDPVAAVGFMVSHGPEQWHPNPDFFFAPGGGPMLDMGPYYVTCLVNLLGPARRVSGAARASFPTRTAGVDGHTIPVATPTHYSTTIEFESGAVATLIMSFDVWGHKLPVMEVYGTAGTMTIPDPNGWNPRETRVYVPEKHDWDVMPMPYRDHWARGIGVADMAYAIRSGRAHRASGDLALHVLEIMFAVEQASNSGQYVELSTTCERPTPLPSDLSERVLDE
jgi:predicted dehydrogenase